MIGSLSPSRTGLPHHCSVEGLSKLSRPNSDVDFGSKRFHAHLEKRLFLQKYVSPPAKKTTPIMASRVWSQKNPLYGSCKSIIAPPMTAAIARKIFNVAFTMLPGHPRRLGGENRIFAVNSTFPPPSPAAETSPPQSPRDARGASARAHMTRLQTT